jgi:hypothetical protein
MMPNPAARQTEGFNELFFYTNLAFLQIFTLIKVPVKRGCR